MTRKKKQVDFEKKNKNLKNIHGNKNSTGILNSCLDPLNWRRNCTEFSLEK